MSAVPGKPFVITRVLDAPRDKVWKAWTGQNGVPRDSGHCELDHVTSR